jgi:hypothetical protein
MRLSCLAGRSLRVEVAAVDAVASARPMRTLSPGGRRNASGDRAFMWNIANWKAALARDAEAVCALTERHYSRTAQVFEQMVRQ